MDIVYLDQNKWIELARVHAGAVISGPIAELYQELAAAVISKKVIFPLSASHVLETSKQNDPARRSHLAETQAKLSRGFAYRSRAGRLEVEVRMALHRVFNINFPESDRFWVLAPSFLEAFEPLDSSIAPAASFDWLRRTSTHMAPDSLYVEYMKSQDDATRRAAHVNVAVGIEKLISRIEIRRARLNGDSVDLRRRAYAAELFLDHMDLFLRVMNELGFSYDQLKERGDQAVRSLIENVPTLDVESRMVARLESETGDIAPNDVFDRQAFYTAIPYSSWVVAEKASISRARQAKLNVAYQVKLSTSLEDLIHAYA